MVTGAVFGMERFAVSINGKRYTFLLMTAVPLLLLAGSNHATADGARVVGWMLAIPGLILSYTTAFGYLPLVRDGLQKGRAARRLR
jgi:cardiolipin synthase